MSKIADRYASAIRSGNLASKPDTTFSDSDVVGAHGLAAKRHPLAIALQRMFLGDNTAAREIVDILSGMAVGKAYRMGVDVTPLQCADISRSVLAWCRDGTCRACHGHGYKLIEGTPHLSEQLCPACKGSRRRSFDREFPMLHLDLARWMLAEVERETAKAGQAAMAALAPRLDLTP